MDKPYGADAASTDILEDEPDIKLLQREVSTYRYQN
jgi:hypothetical protein